MTNNRKGMIDSLDLYPLTTNIDTFEEDLARRIEFVRNRDWSKSQYLKYCVHSRINMRKYGLQSRVSGIASDPSEYVHEAIRSFLNGGTEFVIPEEKSEHEEAWNEFMKTKIYWLVKTANRTCTRTEKRNKTIDVDEHDLLTTLHTPENYVRCEEIEALVRRVIGNGKTSFQKYVSMAADEGVPTNEHAKNVLSVSMRTIKGYREKLKRTLLKEFPQILRDAGTKRSK